MVEKRGKGRKGEEREGNNVLINKQEIIIILKGFQFTPMPRFVIFGSLSNSPSPRLIV